MDRIKMRPTSNAEFPIKMTKHQAKEEMNSTPIRTRDIQNKQNNNHINNRKLEMQRRTSNQELDPLVNSKTIPKKKPNASPRGCVNHTESEAEFKIEIQGEIFGYCTKCATHLSSNGFAVQRITPSRSPKLMKEVRVTPQQKKRQQLLTFLNSLRALEQEYSRKYEIIEDIKLSYERERQNIANFYGQMQDYITYIRDEHLQFLDEESHRNSQICEIQSLQISETLEQIESMKGDIESNMDKIVQEVQEESYTQCMSYYQQKRGVHEHRLEQLGQVAAHASFSTPQFIQEKLNSFKDFVDDITGMLNSKASSADY